MNRPVTLPNTVHISRDHITDLIVGVLARRHGLSTNEVSVSVRRFGTGAEEMPALIAFVRLDAWRPEVLLRGPAIEREIRARILEATGVRVGYVFWRVASTVVAPTDPPGAPPVRVSARRVDALSRAAQAAGATPPADAPVTDWADVEHTLPLELSPRHDESR